MPPKDWYEPIIMPGILSFFGVLIYLLGWSAEQKGRSAPWKWIGALLFIGGIFFGYEPFMNYQDFTYRAALPSNKRVAVVHYAALLLPAFCLLVAIAMQFIPRKAAPVSEP